MDYYSAVSIKGRQDTSYAVTSNGGSAVKYGNYVYFINGSRGYEDDNGTANKFGSVVKGGLYRAELINANGGDDESKGYKDFIPAVNDETGLALASTEKLNYKLEKEHVVNNQLLVPKTIGTSGYSDGGIYIFDNYVYYATPANSKDKSGAIMDDYTLFLRTKLDGSYTEEIYTSQTPTASKPYGFYKYNGRMYLVVMENNTKYNNYINVIDIATKKVKTVATNVDSVIFPTNPVYYNGMANDSVYDYIYIRYSANNYPDYEDDKVNRTGYVLACMRPDGKDIVNFAEGNTALELVAVRDNLVFYKDLYLTETVLVARDRESLFNDGVGFNERVYSTSSLTSAVEVYPFVEGAGNINTNAISMLVVTSESTSSGSSTTTTQNLTYFSSANTQGKNIGSGTTISIQNHDNTGFYYTVNDGTVTSLRHYNLALGDHPSKTISSSVGTSGFKADKIGSYVVYVGTLEDKFDNYTFFANIYAGESYEDASTFVGTRVSGDVRSSIKEIVIDEDSFDKVKTSYEVGDSISVKNLKIVLKYYEAENEEDAIEDKIVDVNSAWISGFDSSATADSQELTISYTDGQDSFATTYVVSIH